ELNRTDGKTDWTSTINGVARERTLIETAKVDVDEALALLQKSKGINGFWEVHRLGEALLTVDKAKAARVAEEAVVRAREGNGAARVTWMGAAGDLAVRAGLTASGTKVLQEAAELAEELPREGDN